jgi:lipopolysaccharide biosynthesis glycosyltransferase
MDPDIFVNGDVSYMTTRLESVNKICAAETNYITKRTTKIDNSFNAGVMLFNLTEFEQKDFDDFTDRVVKYGNIFGDQYIFNKLYHSVYEPLSIEYNSCERGNIDNPVMHFTGANKPWNSRNYEYDKRLRLYTEFVVKNYSRFSDAYLDITP